MSHPDLTAVVHAPDVGWTDLGQPGRLLRLLSAHASGSKTLDAAS